MDLHRQGATGSLKVEGPSYQKALYFRNGRILFGSSNDPRDQLGAILIESGKITPEQLEDVNAKVGPGSPLAKVLADTGFVSQRELSEAARAKVERILSDVITYTSGSFEFEDGVLPKGAVDLKLSTETLVLTAVARVNDRNFVLRHIEGLETVLAPTRDLAERLSQIETEAGGLPQELDGRRSLKEAAARTRLDEFEAAKVACALLFLGLVERTDPSLVLPATVFAAPAEPADLLDLEATAAHAIDSAAPQAAPEPEPEPEAATVSMPAVPVAPPPVAAAPVRPAAPPPAREARASSPAPQQPSSASTRPSKEDMAALDALLNPRNLEGPLTPLEKPSSTQERWVPQFGHKSGQARRARPRRGLVAGGIVAVLALAAGGAWYGLNRPGAAQSRVAAAATAPTAPSLAPPTLASTSPVSTPEPVATAAPPTAAPPTAAPLPSPPAPRDTGRPPAGGLAAARALLQAGSYDDAARAFAAHLKGAAAGTSTIQLLVACSTETIQKAAQAVNAEDLFIVPTRYNGRACYRLCWGLYPSAARAGSAMRSLPDYFRKGGAAPRVVSATEIRP
jgi:hypothetical protein